VAVLDGCGSTPQALSLGGVEVGQVRVGQRVPDYQLATILAGIGVEYEDVRVHEPGQQRPARPEHPETLSPDRPDVWAEHVRHRVED